jgi:D-amino-acid dehydrogenase
MAGTAVADRRVIVVGGGVIGVCCAYFLAKQGAEVTLVERGEIGRGASYGNAGTIAAGHPPLNKPGRIRRSILELLNPKSPLYIPLRWDPGLIRWLWTFRSFCTEHHLEASLAALAPLGHASLDLFDSLIESEGLDCNYERAGYYEICRTKKGLAEVTHDAAMMRPHGFHPREMDGDELREVEPAVRDDVVGGVHFPEAATCDPHLFVLELADRSVRYGTRIETGRGVSEILSSGSRVTGVRLEDGEELEADAVVLATGSYSGSLTNKFGLRLPVRAGKGYHRDLEPPDGGQNLVGVACVLAETSVFCTPMRGFTRLAGTLEFSGVNHQMRPPRLKQLTAAAEVYLEEAGDAVVRSEWCGLRPCTPDGIPYVGPVPGQAGLFIANGHAMLGLTLGPVTGKLIEEHVLSGRTSLPSEALGIQRRI